MPVGDWDHVDREWTADMLRIMMPSDHHAYLGFWDENRRFDRWYVNLEREYRRTEIGIDFVDHFLDIVIHPDLVTWEWKDESELDEAISIGLVSSDQADAIRTQGLLALDRLRTKEPPFAQGWERWGPHPTWTIPSLPSDWAVLGNSVEESRPRPAT